MAGVTKQKNAFKTTWSTFNLLDKIFFWFVLLAGLLFFVATIGYGNLFYSLALAAAMAAPLVFLWGLFKVKKSKYHMRRMLVGSLLMFFVGIPIAMAIEPEASKQETQARLAAEAKLAEETTKQQTEKLTEQSEPATVDFKETTPIEETQKQEEVAQDLTTDAEQPASSETSQVQVSPVDEPSSSTSSEQTASLGRTAVTEKDTVTKVVDGDTIYTSKYKIRIIGLDTPETKDPRKSVQCFGAEASKRMQELVGGKTVLLEIDDSQDTIDKYGRALRNVYLEDGTNVAYSMIRDGYGHEYTYNDPYQWRTEYKAAEKYAIENNKGLWAEATCSGMTSTATTEPTAETTEPDIDEATPSSPQLTSLKKIGNIIKLVGYGPNSSTVSLRLANDDRYDVATAEDGKFSLELPEDAAPFGTIDMESVSGFWIFKSYESLHDTYYYSTFDKEKTFKTSAYAPVITAVRDGSDGDEVRGYYLPNSKLLIKSGDTVLATDATDDRGVFSFTDVKTDTAYANIEIKSYTSAWLMFGIKEGNSLLRAYLNTKENKAFAELPITTKTVTKTESIAFKKVSQNDSTLEKGKTKVTQTGKAGERTITHKVTYRGDKKIKTEEVSNKVTTEPVTQITNVGTYVKPAAPAPRASSPAPTSSATGVVKMSRSGICHDTSSRYYSRTIYYTAYNTLSACLAAGGRVPEQ